MLVAGRLRKPGGTLIWHDLPKLRRETDTSLEHLLKAVGYTRRYRCTEISNPPGREATSLEELIAGDRPIRGAAFATGDQDLQRHRLRTSQDPCPVPRLLASRRYSAGDRCICFLCGRPFSGKQIAERSEPGDRDRDLVAGP